MNSRFAIFAKYLFATMLLAVLLMGQSCTVSYSLTGANIDYNTVKTIQIKDFPNRATLVYPTLSQELSERMRDVYTRSTKLQFTDRNPDIEIEGEITRYDIAQQAVGSDGYATQTRLTMGVRVVYRNNKNPAQNKDLNFSAYRDYSNQYLLTDVQEELVQELVQELVDEIFNGTMSNW